jgi:aminoglycoside phosphotransferase (APT) family kinase protein
MAMHEDELQVDEDIVRQLVGEQFPRWSALPIKQVRSAGTENAIFRIGDRLAARLPLRPQDPAKALTALTVETAATREFAAAAPVPSPEPVAIGAPGAGYPLSWSVRTWLPGHDAVAEDPAGSTAFAHDLAALIADLRSADTRGRRFDGTNRGGRLRDHDEWMEICFRESEDLLDVARCRAMWNELRELPEVDPDVMCHTDLTPPNVLVRDGRLVGVLDSGGFAPADPALDLVSAWHLLDDQQRTVFRRALDCGEIQWQRGMAWALEQAMGLVWYYAESNPVMSGWGRRTIGRLIA